MDVGHRSALGQPLLSFGLFSGELLVVFLGVCVCRTEPKDGGCISTDFIFTLCRLSHMHLALPAPVV